MLKMDIITTTKQIKMHTLRIDDTEILRYLDDHEAWIDLLSTLLVAKPSINGDGSAPAKRAKVKKVAAKRRKTSGPGIELIDCPKCGMPVKPRGLLIHQRGSKCRA